MRITTRLPAGRQGNTLKIICSNLRCYPHKSASIFKVYNEGIGITIIYCTPVTKPRVIRSLC